MRVALRGPHAGLRHLPACVPSLKHLALDLYDTAASQAADAALGAAGARLASLDLSLYGGAVLPYEGLAICAAVTELRLRLSMDRSMHIGPFKYGSQLVSQRLRAGPVRNRGGGSDSGVILSYSARQPLPEQGQTAGEAGPAAAMHLRPSAGCAGGSTEQEAGRVQGGSAGAAVLTAPQTLNGRQLRFLRTESVGNAEPSCSTGGGRAVPPAVAAIASLSQLRSLELYGSSIDRILDPPYRLLGLSALRNLDRLRIDLPPDSEDAAGCVGGGAAAAGTSMPGAAYGSGTNRYGYRPMGAVAGADDASVASAAGGWRLGPLLAALTWIQDLDLGVSYALPPEALPALAPLTQLTRLRCGTILTPPVQHRLHHARPPPQRYQQQTLAQPYHSHHHYVPHHRYQQQLEARQEQLVWMQPLGQPEQGRRGKPPQDQDLDPWAATQPDAPRRAEGDFDALSFRFPTEAEEAAPPRLLPGSRSRSTSPSPPPLLSLPLPASLQHLQVSTLPAVPVLAALAALPALRTLVAQTREEAPVAGIPAGTGTGTRAGAAAADATGVGAAGDSRGANRNSLSASGTGHGGPTLPPACRAAAGTSSQPDPMADQAPVAPALPADSQTLPPAAPAAAATNSTSAHAFPAPAPAAPAAPVPPSPSPHPHPLPTPACEPLRLALAGEDFQHEYRTEISGRPEEVAAAVALLLRLLPPAELRRVAVAPFGRSPAVLEGPHAGWLAELAPLAGVVEALELAAFALAPGELDALRAALPGLKTLSLFVCRLDADEVRRWQQDAGTGMLRLDASCEYGNGYGGLYGSRGEEDGEGEGSEEFVDEAEVAEAEPEPMGIWPVAAELQRAYERALDVTDDEEEGEGEEEGEEGEAEEAGDGEEEEGGAGRGDAWE